MSIESLMLPNGRFMRRLPTVEVAGLARVNKEFYMRENDSLDNYNCSAAPTNIVGAMLLELNRDRIDEIIKYNAPSNEHILPEPNISQTDNIGLYYLDNFGHEKPTGLRSGHILTKHQCGIDNIGVITTGQLAGVLIRESGNGATVLRVWNDFSASTQFKPYSPFDNSKYYEPAGFDGLNEFERLWDELISNTHKTVGRPPLTSELFFKLCSALQIPVDKEKFHTTTSSICFIY